MVREGGGPDLNTRILTQGTLRPRSHCTRSRFAHKFVCKPFDVACNLCEHSHLLQCVPSFACTCYQMLSILCERGLTNIMWSTTDFLKLCEGFSSVAKKLDSLRFQTAPKNGMCRFASIRKPPHKCSRKRQGWFPQTLRGVCGICKVCKTSRLVTKVAPSQLWSFSSRRVMLLKTLQLFLCSWRKGCLKINGSATVRFVLNSLHFSTKYGADTGVHLTTEKLTERLSPFVARFLQCSFRLN